MAQPSDALPNLYDMLVIRLPQDVEKRLERLAAKTGRTKTYHAKEAIQEFVDAEEDHLIAVARLEKERPAIPIKDVERRLGLAD